MKSIKIIILILGFVFIIADALLFSQTVLDIARLAAYGIVINLLSEYILELSKKKSKRRKKR
jgi:uncharacterized membrane protein YjfL (UPF0719 family)